MKHAKLLIFSIIAISFCLFNEIKSSRTILSKMALKNKFDTCQNKCNECQRVVYALKFKQSFDCRSFQCQNMCENISAQWALTQFNPFDEFKKDVFGKCEICFRQGHCSIVECHDQQKNELEVIEAIVNNLPLRGKNIGAKLETQASSQPNIKISAINKKINSNIADSLKIAIKTGSATNLAGQVNNLMQNYILNPNPAYFLHPYSILNINPLYAVPSGSINYWSSSARDLFPGVREIQKSAKDIQNNISKINDLKKNEKNNKKANNKANHALKNEKKALEDLEDGINEVADNLDESYRKIKDLSENVDIKDQFTKNSLNQSLHQIKTNSVELDNIVTEVGNTLNALR